MSYELIFVVEALGDSTEDAVYAELDALISEHDGQTLITMTAEGATALLAAKWAVDMLEGLGVSVIRVSEDLVTRRVIASRAGVTTQAVGLWARGERGGQSFPKPLHLVAGGLWLWGDIVTWLTARGLLDEKLSYPTAVDHAELNYWVIARRSPRRNGYLLDANYRTSARAWAQFEFASATVHAADLGGLSHGTDFTLAT